MRATGIVRRVDDLGRILLPKEISRRLGISEGTALELFFSSEGIMLKKYYPENKMIDEEKLKAVLKETYLEIANYYDVSDVHDDGDKVACVASRFQTRVLEKLKEIQ